MGEQISPELVSVDPELAATARAELPEEPWRTFVPAAPPTALAEPAAAEPIVVTRRPLRRVAIATGLVATAAAGVVAGSSSVFTRAHDRPSFEAIASHAAASAAATTAVAAPKRTVARPAATVAPSSPAPATTARRPARTPSSTAVGAFAPSRTFAWAPTPGAEEYRVRFYRGDRVVLEGRVEQARLVLPHGFAFRPGAYRWTVEPRRLETYEPAVVDSRFEVAG